jgi:hypothetical protein
MSINELVSDFIVERYCNVPSERFVGVDCLLTSLEDGWTIDEIVLREQHWLTSSRRVFVYHFDIKRGAEVSRVSVINNPLVTQLIAAYDLRVISNRDASLN